MRYEDIKVGDLIRLTIPDTETTLTGRVEDWYNTLLLPGTRETGGVGIKHRLETGWIAELLDRPVVEPEPGVYVGDAQIDPEGYATSGALVVKYKPGSGWTDGNGERLDDYTRTNAQRWFEDGTIVRLGKVD